VKDFGTCRTKGKIHYAPDIHKIIDKHSKVFGPIPPGVPPNRGFEHIIELEEGAKPIIIMPYRHPKKYKDEIEKAIKEIMDMGHIRPSSSPFSSSVVLVKKKDGTMRMCINFRELNKKTIKSRYPIPRIDELLDELHGAVYFTKIDLRFGYHQIKMREEDILETSLRASSTIRAESFWFLNKPSRPRYYRFFMTNQWQGTKGLAILIGRSGRGSHGRASRRML
jgi:hypothetical protein